MILTIRCEDCGGNRGNANREDVEVFAKGASMIAFSELRDEWSPAIDALEGEVGCQRYGRDHAGRLQGRHRRAQVGGGGAHLGWVGTNKHAGFI